MTTNHVLEYNLVIMGSEIIIMFDTVNNDKVFTLFFSLLSMDSSLIKLPYKLRSMCPRCAVFLTLTIIIIRFLSWPIILNISSFGTIRLRNSKYASVVKCLQSFYGLTSKFIPHNR